MKVYCPTSIMLADEPIYAKEKIIGGNGKEKKIEKKIKKAATKLPKKASQV